MIIILISTFIVIAIAFLFYHSYTACDKLAKQLKKEQKTIQSMRLILIEQQKNQEKLDIALHDKLGANLSAIHLHMNIVKQHIPESKFQIIKNLLLESIQETRKMSKQTKVVEKLVA